MIRGKRLFAALMVAALCLTACGETSGTASRDTGKGSDVEKALEQIVADAEASNGTSGSDTSGQSTDSSTAVSSGDSVQHGSATFASTNPADTNVPTPSVEMAEDLGDYVDLTEMSATMVYAQVYNMMFYPDQYVGKTIKAKGLYSDYLAMDKGKHYFAIFIQDATQCCAQGIEFEPVGDYKYPEDYPTDGDEIVVEGVFDTYVDEDDGWTYSTLRNAKFCD